MGQQCSLTCQDVHLACWCCTENTTIFQKQTLIALWGRSTQWDNSAEQQIHNMITITWYTSEYKVISVCGTAGVFQTKVGLQLLPLSSPLSSKYSIMGYCFVPTGSLSSSSTLQKFLRHEPIVRTDLHTSLSARTFPITPPCSGHKIHKNLWRYRLNTVTYANLDF